MSPALVAAALLAQGLDLATYLAAPHLESMPIGVLPVPVVVVAKVAGVCLALLVVAALRSPEWQRGALAFIIAVGALGAGANLTVLL